MNVLELSRWQFGITTVYHFLFVPITIGLAFLVAGFETAWLRSGDDRWLKLTRFYGKLFLINFAMGVVTGIVQEFQFGMNWSHREELTSFVSVLTNPTQLVTFPHTIAGCFLVAGALVAAVALWHLIRRPAGTDPVSQSSAAAFCSAARAGRISVAGSSAAAPQEVPPAASGPMSGAARLLGPGETPPAAEPGKPAPTTAAR